MSYSKAPSTKLPASAVDGLRRGEQAPEKHQGPNLKRDGGGWSFEFGASLEHGVWNLELGAKASER